MTRSEFLRKLDELLVLAPGTLTGKEQLDAVESWDSTAIVMFIALLDEQFGVQVPAESIVGCQTIGELVDLAGDRFTA